MVNEACELLNGDGLRLDQAGAAQVGGLIADTLDGLGLPVEVVDTRVGPTVTTYGLRLGEVQRVKQVPRLDADGRPMLDGRGNVQTVRAIETRSVTTNQIISRLKDLQVALGTGSVRVVVPLDADLIGVEAPSSARPLVPLRAVIEKAPMDGSLPVGLGVGDLGAAQSIDLAQMPHMLVAGATGSGKSVWINSMLLSLLVNKSPDELELVLIDPKRVELAPYRDLPHLMRPIVTDASEAAPTLQSVIGEMMGRYRAMEDAGVRNIATYNDSADAKLPYIVVVIDELADLMMTSAKDVEDALCRLAQMGRATGIHLVVATQRPSVDVITGLIKANFPSRISFAVASATDSRTVLDQSGAEKLLGKGDMLYLPVEASSPLRIQGAMVTDEEIEAVTEWWGKSEYVVSRDEREIVRAANELIYQAAWEFPISVRGYDDKIIEELVRRKIIRPITHKDWLFTFLEDDSRIPRPQDRHPPFPEIFDSFEEAIKSAWISARKSNLAPDDYTLMCGDPGDMYEFRRSNKRVDEDIIDSREIRYDVIEDLKQNNLKTREYWRNRWNQ